jgi:hypothetical protein
MVGCWTETRVCHGSDLVRCSIRQSVWLAVFGSVRSRVLCIFLLLFWRHTNSLRCDSTVIGILQLLAQEKWSWMALPWLLEYQGGNAEQVWLNPVRCRVFIDSFLLLWMLTPSSMSTISVLLQSQDREKRLSMASFRPIQNQVEYPEWAGSHMVHLHH